MIAKPKVKRDKYAGLTRKQRRARQRDEIFAKDEEEGGAKMPTQRDQYLAARSAKSEMRNNPNGVKRKLNDESKGGAKKPKKEPKEPKAAPEPERERKGPSKKMRSRSKAKYSKPRRK